MNTSATSAAWEFDSLQSGNSRRTEELWLYPELNISAMVDDYLDLDGEGQLTEYVRHLSRKYPQYLEQDAVPIYWSVHGEGFGPEPAPFQQGNPTADDFLTFYTWPVSAVTGEQLDWFRLPVRYSRFPEFGEALGWVPSPMQPTAPLRSIMLSREGRRG